MNARAAGPGGASLRYTTFIGITRLRGTSATRIFTSVPASRSACTMCSGHVPPAQALAKKRVLGAQVREPPSQCGQHGVFAALRERGPVGEHELHVLLESRFRYDAALRCERVRRGNDGCERNVEQWLFLKLVRHQRQRPDHADVARALEHGLDHSAERFDVKPERGVREGCARVASGLRQALHRIHHVDGCRELRLEPFAHRASARFESVDGVRDRACVD